jgi:hypothetical protein
MPLGLRRGHDTLGSRARRVGRREDQFRQDVRLRSHGGVGRRDETGGAGPVLPQADVGGQLRSRGPLFLATCEWTPPLHP